MNDKMQPEELFVTFVLPCLNESKTLNICISQIRETLGLLKKDGDIIVADNGSVDDSPEIAKSLGAKVVHVPIQGYGAALLFGCKSARSKYIVIGDADGSYDFRESIPMLNRLEEGCDLVLGSRFKGKIYPGAMPWKNRYIGTPTLTHLLNLFYNTHITDSQSGLRAFRKESFDKLSLHSTGMEFASEMLVQASLRGLKIDEVPISLYPDKRGRKPHLRPWRDGWRHLRFLLLYCPFWLYLIPGLFLLFFGFLINTILFLTPESDFITFRQLFFGTHWMVPSILSSTIGMQMVCLGVLTSLYSVEKNLYPGTRIILWFSKYFRMEINLLIGGVLILVGVGIEIFVLIDWILRSFGELNSYRPALYGLMWIVLGVELSTNSFFLDLLCHDYRTGSIGKTNNLPDS